MNAPRARGALAEFLGTGLLVTVVVGSGIMAAELSPDDVGLQLLDNSLATAAGLGVLILIFAPVSGAHFNPVVSLAAWAFGRRDRTGPTGRDLAAYLPAQVFGAIGGAILANLMFGHPAVTISTHHRAAPHLLLGEVVATAGLLLLITALVRRSRTHLAAPAVAAYIGAAYWFTSSTSFANPAVTVGRAFSDTFAGIAPSSVPAFIVAQIIGAALGATAAAVLHPRTAAPADQADDPASAAGDSPARG